MKIIQLIQKPQLRGAEIFACQLANHLQENNHQSLLISIFHGNAVLPFQGEHYQLNRPAQKRFWDFAGWKAFADIIDREKPDIIQANAGDTLKFAAFSKLIFRWDTPLIFRNASKSGDFINSKLKYWFNKFLLQQVSHVISVSALCRVDFITTFNYSSNNITTVPIGIEKSAIADLSGDLNGIFASGPVLVSVGSLVPEKNHQGLFRIFVRIREEIPAAKLVVIGSGQLQQHLVEYVKHLNLEKHVYFLGYRNDVLPAVKASSALLMPSHIEGLPGVILEAMYCKTPVIANDVGGISEVVITGKTGWLIAKNDETAFANAVVEVLRHKEKVSRITAEAYEHVLREYNNEIIAPKFIEVYKNISRSAL